jgi:hypothetical protein
MKLVPYLDFNTLLNTLDVAGYPGDCYLKISRDKRIVFLSFFSRLLPKHVVAYRATISVDLMKC